ncbi:MAG: hypothetical protein JO124_19805 [Hyphomicrobiales bacterium]|nr:hypothetical protein [Hyphomicrobiales bacterium]
MSLSNLLQGSWSLGPQDQNQGALPGNLQSLAALIKPPEANAPDQSSLVDLLAGTSSIPNVQSALYNSSASLDSGLLPPYPGYAYDQFSDPFPNSSFVSRTTAATSPDQNSYELFSDPAENGPPVESGYDRFSDLLTADGEPPELGTTNRSAPSPYDAFSDRVMGRGETASFLASTPTGEDYDEFSDPWPGNGESEGPATTQSAGGHDDTARIPDNNNLLIPISTNSPNPPDSQAFSSNSPNGGSASTRFFAALAAPTPDTKSSNKPSGFTDLAQSVRDMAPPLESANAAQPKAEASPGIPQSPSVGQRLIQSTTDLVPGAYYQRLATEQFHAGNYGAAAVYEVGSLLDAALGVATFGRSSAAESAVRRGTKIGAEAAARADAEATSEATGGAYLLRDPKTGRVMRTGRSNDLIRREGEHGRNPILKDFSFEPVFRTDDYAEQRGLEQYLYELHTPPLNRMNGVGPRNKNADQFMNAAKSYLERNNVK